MEKELAAKVYTELMALYNGGDRDKIHYLNLVREYARISYAFGNDYAWRLGENVYTMYNSFSGDCSFFTFCEDAAMMVYRLNGGMGYNTHSFVDEIRGRFVNI